MTQSKSTEPVVKRPHAIYFTRGKGRTKQSFRDQCDINLIMDRARKSGVLPINARAGVYADCSKIPDYRSALEIVKEGKELFMQYDPRLRERWNNDPGVMMEWLRDPANRDEAEKLGLMVKRAPAPKGTVQPEPKAEAGVVGKEPAGGH